MVPQRTQEVQDVRKLVEGVAILETYTVSVTEPTIN